MENTIFLAGATGYIGSNFIRRYDLTLPIIPISRRIPSNGFPRKMPVVNYANIASFSVDRVTAETATMVHLIGCSRETRHNAIYDGNTLSTKLLVDACKRNGIEGIIYLSGYGVDHPSSSIYYKTKAAAELLIKDSGLRYVILRCSYIVGRNDELTPHVIQAAKDGNITIPGDGSYRIQPVFLDDILSIIFHLATNERNYTGTYDVLGESISFRKFVTDIATVINPSSKTTEQDLAVIIRQAIFSDTPPYSLSELGILVADKVGEPTKNLFGVSITPYDEIIRRISGSQNQESN